MTDGKFLHNFGNAPGLRAKLVKRMAAKKINNLTTLVNMALNEWENMQPKLK